MRFLRAWTLLLVATGAWGGETVCTNPGGNATAVYRARGIAAQILREAGVHVEFKDDEDHCRTVANAMVIAVSHQTPEDHHPGALAYAMPFEGTRIVVFYDRVRRTVRADAVPSLLGHVLAHEIVHMLQGVERHSTTGVMKQKWNYHDYVEMELRPLRFTDEDVLLIRQGLKTRASGRAASVGSLKYDEWRR